MLGAGYGSSSRKYLRDSRYPTPVLARRFPRSRHAASLTPPPLPIHLHLSITDRQGRFVNINRDLRDNKKARRVTSSRHAGVTIPRRLSLIAGEIYVNSKINATVKPDNPPDKSHTSQGGADTDKPRKHSGASIRLHREALCPTPYQRRDYSIRIFLMTLSRLFGLIENSPRAALARPFLNWFVRA